LFAADSRRVNRVASELGSVDSNNIVTRIVPPPAGTHANIIKGHTGWAESLVQGVTLGAFLEFQFSSPNFVRKLCVASPLAMD